MSNRLIRLPEVVARTGLSRSSIYLRIARGEFPKQVAVGPNAAAWAEHEIDAWIAERIAERDRGKGKARLKGKQAARLLRVSDARTS